MTLPFSSRNSRVNPSATQHWLKIIRFLAERIFSFISGDADSKSRYAISSASSNASCCSSLPSRSSLDEADGTIICAASRSTADSGIPKTGKVCCTSSIIQAAATIHFFIIYLAFIFLMNVETRKTGHSIGSSPLQFNPIISTLRMAESEQLNLQLDMRHPLQR